MNNNPLKTSNILNTSPISHPSATPLKKPKLLIYAIALILVIIIAVVLGNYNKNTSSNASARVTISSSGFVPQVLTIKAGNTVKWQDTDSSTTHMVVSDPYPQDNGLPGLKSNQLGKGTSYIYKFTKKGTYGYHDYLHPTVNGSVVVK